jgi:hypothetical protein
VKRTRRIKTTWASLSVSETGAAVVCVKGNAPQYLRFESLEQLAQALARKAVVARKWAVAVPRDLCILKSIALPAADLDEAARMLEFEVQSLVPLPPEEVIYGCTIAGKRDNLLNVFVYLVKADVLERYLGTYKAVGIEPQRVTPDVLAMHAWFRKACHELDEPAVFVLAGPAQCHILTSHEDHFQGGQRLHLNGDMAVNASQIARDVLHHGRQIADPDQGKITVILAGQPDLISPTEAQLRSHTDNAGFVGNVSRIASPRVSPCGSAESPKDDTWRESYEGVIAAGLLELCTGAKQAHTNLVPRGYLVKEQRRALLARGLRVGIMSVLLVFGTWACLVAANRRVEKACTIIAAQMAPIQKVAGGVDRKRQRVQAIQRQLSSRGSIAETIAELYECTPQAISISQLDVTWKQGTMSIDIKGQADLLPTAFEYTNAVREAKLLRAMQIINAQQIPRAGGGSVVEFKATCTVTESLEGATR